MLGVHVFEEDILSQIIGSGIKRTPFVKFSYLIDNLIRLVTPFQHKRVDQYVIASTAAHCFQGLSDCVVGRQIGGNRAAVLQMGGRFAVRYHDD